MSQTTIDELITFLQHASDYHGGETLVSVRIVTPYEAGEYLEVDVTHRADESELTGTFVTRELLEVPSE